MSSAETSGRYRFPNEWSDIKKNKNKHILFLWFSSQLDRVRHSGLWYIFRNSNEQVDTKATTTVLKYLVISKDFYHGPKSTQKVRITLQQTLRHTLLTASYIYV